MTSKSEILAQYTGIDPSNILKIDNCEYAVSTFDREEIWGIYTPDEVVDEVFVPYLENSVDIDESEWDSYISSWLEEPEYGFSAIAYDDANPVEIFDGYYISLLEFFGK